MAEITTVTSEALQAELRRLLPSQQGFGEDLQASNVITPIIDLTTAAEGSSTPQFLQTAVAFGSQTVFDVNNTATVIINTAGFYRVLGIFSGRNTSGSNTDVSFSMSDGTSSKKVFGGDYIASGNESAWAVAYDFNVFLRSGDSLTASSTSSRASVIGSTRQIADVNGNLVNPVGFTPQ